MMERKAIIREENRIEIKEYDKDKGGIGVKKRRHKLQEEEIMTREKRQQGQRKKRRRGGYDFTDKVHSQKGMISVTLAVSAFIGLIGLIIASCMEKGNGGFGIGAGGSTVFLIIVAGLILGIWAFREEEVKFTYPVVGVISNGILLISGIVIYLMGFVV